MRTTVHGSLSTFVVKFHIDVNLGDPLWPTPEEVDVPRLLGGAPIRMRGYRVDLILAEKIVTAIQRGTANTRWRDFVDIAALAHLDINDGALVESIRRVAEFRQVPIRPLRDVLSGFPEIGQQRWAGWRRKQGHTPRGCLLVGVPRWAPSSARRSLLTNRGQAGLRRTSFARENGNDQGVCPGHLVSEGGLEPPRP